ncbi:MAG: PadR family transcriptional regulator [Anaerolineaceae bacterium]|nr:PadR family transcriptional regulator [Anaerolineaceae bacterium]
MNEKENLINNFRSELKRGVLVLSVLAATREASYGYQLIRFLGDAGLEAEGNTLYPLLRRLEEQNLLESKWNVDGDKPRKYYQITPFGQEVLEKLKENWLMTVASVAHLLGEENNG